MENNFKIANKLNAFVAELIATTKRTEKENILNAHKEDIDIQQFMEFIYNPFKITGVSKKKWERGMTLPNTRDYYPADFHALYSFLTDCNTGRDEDLCKFCTFARSFDESDRELIKKIVTKDFQLGIDAKTINKVFGKDFIPVFDVQLAKSYQERKHKILGKEVALSCKIDGTRIWVVKNGNEITYYNRSGIQMEGLNEITNAIVDAAWNGIIDGELYAIGEFKESKDGYKETMKRSRIKGEKTGLKVRAFDFLTLEEFQLREAKTPYWSRRAMIESDVVKCKFIEPLPLLYKGIATEEIIDKIANEQIANGEEGIMINDTSSFYQFKRTDALLKYKLFQEWDLEVVGFEEGKGRNKGRLGSLVVEYKGNLVNVGGSYSDAIRQEIWDNKAEWLGKTIIVKGFEPSSNQKGGESIRFPEFKGKAGEIQLEFIGDRDDK